MRPSTILCCATAFAGFSSALATPFSAPETSASLISSRDATLEVATRATTCNTKEYLAITNLLSQFLAGLPTIINDLEGTLAYVKEIDEDSGGLVEALVPELDGLVTSLSSLNSVNAASLATILGALLPFAQILQDLAAAVVEKS